MIKRRKSREIKIGNLYMGGDNPVVIQSMTNTFTKDADATVKQILELEAEGCQLVRVTVNNEEAAEAIKEIKKGIHIPMYKFPILISLLFLLFIMIIYSPIFFLIDIFS